MRLNEILTTINREALKNLIENGPVYESVMIKAAFKDADILKMTALELYRHHFALFHVLYTMQNEYVKDGKYLYVHFMRTGVFDYPDISECAYFDTVTMSFCRNPVVSGGQHCALHNEQLGDDRLESLSLKYFYLDAENYAKLDSVTAESLLSGAWEILSSGFSLDDAYRSLGLHGHENLRTVKMRFRDLCKKYHPDQGGDKDKFMTVNRAYRMVSKWLEQSGSLS